jgi:hypothetical protein
MTEIELFKIADFEGPLTRLNGEKRKIVIVKSAGPICDFFTKKLENFLGDSVSIKYQHKGLDPVMLSTVRYAGRLNLGESRRGKSDGLPSIGRSFSMDNSGWLTSRVSQIIDDDIIITDNSVYVIYDISKFRDDKLNILGIL